MSQSKAKLPEDIRLPNPRDEWERLLIRYLTDYLRQNSQQVNDLATGRRAASFNEDSVVPTSGRFGVGDFVPKKDPAESGTASDKYVHAGWLCVQGGSASASSFIAVSWMTNN